MKHMLTFALIFHQFKLIPFLWRHVVSKFVILESYEKMHKVEKSSSPICNFKLHFTIFFKSFYFLILENVGFPIQTKS
jgi:hypothetical protein